MISQKKRKPYAADRYSILIDANLNNYLSVFEQLKKSLDNRIPGVLITMVTAFTEETVMINRYWMSDTFIPDMPEEFLSAIEPLVRSMLTEGIQSDYREIELKIPDEEPASLFFLEAVFPPEKLIIAGAGHIGRALAHLAEMLDFEVTVIDDRSEYACTENIPEASHIIVEDIGEALKILKKSNDTYVVIVTRGHKDDADSP